MKKEKQEEKPSVITKIQVQRRRKDRFNIYLDGEYAFPVSEAVLIKIGLFKGMELTKERQKEIELENTAYLSYSIAVDYLSYSLRSEKEVRKKLKENDIPFDVIDGTIQRLHDQRYIDDRIYGESYTRTAANINRKGPFVIARELKLKGLKEEVIALSLEQYPEEYQIENGIKLAEKLLNKQQRTSSRDAIMKARMHLQQKGYTRDVIDKIMLEVDTETPEDEEFAALRIQGDKIWRRYARKAEGFQLIQKVKTNLFQKGYPSEMISEYIEEKKQEEDL
ncbi:recombination regulator RecX [Jeotgalibaca sp. MA1X17-3]|uniref:recombination regulator RecX n=1 Tax=Jeotgalibaca sp. MA1X17-3 TaxID=2908211 RepID=UPI001F1D5FA1|nr:recombination regulator RecX [Jeotgalibaca sp. MA1X17-3]UJF15222.1 recombination regulator RecX [Jeotgalibaca sp. MA1X17-3]